jgi:hypothetical protein
VNNNTPVEQDKDSAKVDGNASIQKDDAAAQEQSRVKGPRMKLSKRAQRKRTEERVRRKRLQGRESRFPVIIFTTKEQETFFDLCRELAVASNYQRHIDNIAKATKPQVW